MAVSARTALVREKVAGLKAVLRDRKSLLVVLQDFPDPDAIAAAQALRVLARSFGELTTSVACGGVVGRAENQALVRYLGVNLLALDGLDLHQFDAIAMVDTQPATGNNSLDREVVPDIVIDHHPLTGASRKAPFRDVRSQYGSTSTMLYEYLKETEIAPSVPLATALVYGIRSDTNDLGRETTQADIDAFLALYPMANKRKLGKIETERLPRDYFEILAISLAKAQTYGRCIVTNLGAIDNPDMIGEVADLLLRNEESEWALCYGTYREKMLLSLRTLEAGQDAGKLMHRIVGRKGTGGGHRVMAGGQIPLAAASTRFRHALGKAVVSRFLKALGESASPARKLVSVKL